MAVVLEEIGSDVDPNVVVIGTETAKIVGPKKLGPRFDGLIVVGFGQYAVRGNFDVGAGNSAVWQ